jgi:hypothetical protein
VSDVQPQRDYRKFLDGDGQLRARYLPRKVYTELVNLYRQNTEVIDLVFNRLYFAWDLDQEVERLRRAGGPASTAEAAQSVINRMDDEDWWRVTAAFERALQRDFADLAARWSEILDPIYDEQERLGWVDLHT